MSRNAPDYRGHHGSGRELLDVYVGIDDTDNLESRGTGHLVRDLAVRLTETGVARARDVTRHQLLFDPRIPYTSHNSSLCLVVEVASIGLDALADVCRDVLRRDSAPGSDAGLCIAPRAVADATVEAFGWRAKHEIVTRAEAEALADRAGIVLEGLTGDHGGMIGALAAVGLRHGGRDGRVTWRPGLREMTGIATAADVLASTSIDEVRRIRPLDDRGGHETGDAVDPQDLIDLRPRPRVVLIDGRAVLLVEKAGSPYDNFAWQLASKAVFKTY